MLVACSLVNLTTWRQARPAFYALQTLYPEPVLLADALEDDLHPHLRPLGLRRRRGKSLIRLANAWVLWGPPACAKEVLKYPGMGKYASDSWAIFVDGRTDVSPNDGKLNWYMERLHGRPDEHGATGPEVPP